ncbi:MAG: cobalt-precorrin 5A hydrolase [Desulfobacterales bacterium]
MNQNNKKTSVAVWAVTRRGAEIADLVSGHLPGVTVYAGKSAGYVQGAQRFDSLARAVEKRFADHGGHVFVMSAGIAVRMIAPLISSKHTDPGVVAIDDSGKFCISLLSGHLGGANALAEKIAGITGACPVITTATDRAGVPAIDVLAGEHGLEIENPGAVKAVSTAFIEGKKVPRFDPYKVLDSRLEKYTEALSEPLFQSSPGIYIYHETKELPENVLVLRPASLAVGMGCNSGTSAEELCSAVYRVFAENRLSVKSIRLFATITQKTSEPAMQETAGHFARPLTGFSRQELAEIKNVPTPSEMVEKHMGVKNVCEAAAIKAAQNGPISAAKQKTANTTVAVAVLPFL